MYPKDFEAGAYVIRKGDQGERLQQRPNGFLI